MTQETKNVPRTILLWPKAAGELSKADEKKLERAGFDVVLCSAPGLVKQLTPIRDPEVMVAMAKYMNMFDSSRAVIGKVVLSRILAILENESAP